MYIFRYADDYTHISSAITGRRLTVIVLTRIVPPKISFPGFRAASKSRVRPATVERLREDHEFPRDGALCSGGYNEAFIVQYWANYAPRH